MKKLYIFGLVLLLLSVMVFAKPGGVPAHEYNEETLSNGNNKIVWLNVDHNKYQNLEPSEYIIKNDVIAFKSEEYTGWFDKPKFWDNVKREKTKKVTVQENCRNENTGNGTIEVCDYVEEEVVEEYDVVAEITLDCKIGNWYNIYKYDGFTDDIDTIKKLGYIYSTEYCREGTFTFPVDSFSSYTKEKIIGLMAGNLLYFAADHSNYDAQLVSDMEGATGIVNGALNFDGSIDQVSYNTDYVITPTSSDYSWSLWFRRDTGTAGTVLYWRDADTDRFNINIPSNDIIRVDFGTADAYSTNTVNDNLWHHIVVNFNSTDGKLYLYLDGAEVTYLSQAADLAIPTIDNNGIKIIGSAGGTDYFDGNLDELLFYDRLLTQDEIDNLYNGGNGSQDYSLDNLIHFDTLDQLYDFSGNSYYGDYNNGAGTIADGKLNSAFGFEGINEYIDIPTISDTTENFSYGGWFYFDNNNTGMELMNAEGLNRWGVRLKDSNDGNIDGRLSARLSGSNYLNYLGIQPNTWYHVMVVMRETNYSLYVNGELEDTDTVVAHYADWAGLRLGAYFTGGEYFNGNIDEVGVWNRVLTDDEVSVLYNNGNGVNIYNVDTAKIYDEYFNTNLTRLYYLNDTSYNESEDIKDSWIDDSDIDNGQGFGKDFYHGTVTGATLTSSCQTNMSQCYEFDGVDDYVNVSETMYFNEQTISMWIKADTLTGFDTLISGASNYRIQTLDTGAVYCDDITTNDDDVYSSAGLITTGTWHMVTLTVDSTNMSIYVDGTLDNSVTYSGTIDDLVTANIGRYYSGGNNFDGIIDEVRIWNRSLSQAEIQEEMQSSAVANTQDIVAYYDFNGDADDRNHLSTGPKSASNYTNKAMNFDGLDDYVSYGLQNFSRTTENYTFSSWVYGEAFVDNNPGFGAMNILGTFADIGLACRFGTTSYNCGGWNSGDFNTGAAFDYGEWHMVTVVYTAGSDSRNIYLDGQYSFTDSGGAVFDVSDTLYSGYNAYTQLSPVKLADQRIYEKALDEDEILTLYDGLQLINVTASKKVNGDALDTFTIDSIYGSFIDVAGVAQMEVAYGEADFTFTKDDWYDKTIPLDIVSGTDDYNIADIHNAQVVVNLDQSIYNAGFVDFNVSNDEHSFIESFYDITGPVSVNLTDGTYNFTLIGTLKSVSFEEEVFAGANVINLTAAGDNYVYFYDMETGLGIPNAEVTVTYPNNNEINLTTDSEGRVDFKSYDNNTIQTGNYSFTFGGTQGYVSPTTFTSSFNISEVPFNISYNLSYANLTIKIYNGETNQLLTTGPGNEIQVSITNIGTFETTTGIVTITNATLSSGEYTVYVANPGYTTAQKTFTFLNQEVLDISLTIFDLTSENLGNVYVTVFDSFFDRLPGVDIRLQEYDYGTSSFIEVNQKVTNAGGDATFQVVKDTKSYRFYAQYEKGGITYEGYSSQSGDIYNSDETSISIYIDTYVSYGEELQDGLNINVFNKTLTGNTSYHHVDFYNEYGTDNTVCLGYYYIDGVIERTLIEICETGSSGTINYDGGYLLDRSYRNIVRVYEQKSGLDPIFYSQIYSKDGGFEDQYSPLIPMLLLVGLIVVLAIAIYLKRIDIFIYGNIALSIVWGLLTPSFKSASSIALNIIISFIVMYHAKQKTNNNDI